jgi:Bacterial Ig-like domain
MSLWGRNASTRSQFGAQTVGVQIPAGKTTYLHFKHSYGFEDNNAGTYWDGGMLWASANQSAFNPIQDSSFTHNGYSGTLSANSDNPIAGQRSFVGESNGYISSRVNLSSFAGQTVQLMWLIGTDSSVGDDGWYLDDVRVYTCGGDTTPPKVNNNTSPANNATGVSRTANVIATFSEAMNTASVETAGVVTLKKSSGGAAVAASVTYNPTTKKVTLNPNLSLARNTLYSATITTGARDLAGNQLDQNATTPGNQAKTWKFTTVP